MSKRRAVQDEKVEKKIAKSSVVGAVLTCGCGDMSQLGLGSNVRECKTPTEINALQGYNVTTIAAGAMHNAIVTDTGSAWTWGCNDDAALGRSGDEWIPGRVCGALMGICVIRVACGDCHTICLTNTGRVWSWGTYKDIAGYIGYDQKTDKQVVPTMVPGLENIVAIGAGENHDIALTTKGQVYEWGDPRTAGRVSDRLKRTKLVPRQIHFDKKKAVPMANVWACGLASFTKSTNGQCFSWGINNWGQLGDNSRVNRGNPTEITTFNNKDIIKIVGGQHHTLALSADGTVYSWGRAHYGRLGQGKPADPTGKWSDLDDRLIPTDIPNLTCCVSIAAGETHSLAVTKDGSLFAWGSNDLHQLGLNNDQDIHTPTKVDTQYHITDAAAGSQHSIVLC